MSDFAGQEYIKKIFINNGINITDIQAKQFYLYYEMLVEKNKVMNLTAITEFEDVVVKHFLDSCYKVQIPDNFKTMIDVGTGAGFPGLPLKILYPELKITLLDSLNKRVLFLQEVIDNLGLNNIDVFHGRAEDAARDKNFRGVFDVAVSRAVANLSTLCEYDLPYVKKGGLFIAYKGDGAEELKNAQNAISVLGGDCKNIKVDSFELPELGDKRMLIYIPKIKETPKLYPRKAGTPSKQPL